jgi:hypothetical protein
LDEIAHVEDQTLPTRTKAASGFVGPLAGFWHKHFFDATCIAPNLLQEMEQNWERIWYKHFRERQEAATGQSWVDASFDETATKAPSYASVFDWLAMSRLLQVRRAWKA